MKFGLYCVLGVCLWGGTASASAVFTYNNDINGATVLPAVGASPFNGYLATSWIFGEVSVDPGFVGESVFFQAVRVTNPTPDPVDIGLIVGLWSANGPDGRPGTLLDETYTYTLAYQPNFNYIGVYTNYLIPAGNFWVGYALETYGASTSAAQLNALKFDLGDAPSVGTSANQALLGTQAGFLGSNPTISNTPVNGYLSQSIQIFVADTPEPSSAMLLIGGLLVGLSRARKASVLKTWLSRRESGHQRLGHTRS